jgi:hypothetical protein
MPSFVFAKSCRIAQSNVSETIRKRAQFRDMPNFVVWDNILSLVCVTTDGVSFGE